MDLPAHSHLLPLVHRGFARSEGKQLAQPVVQGACPARPTVAAAPYDDLLSRARADDPAAFRTLIERLQPIVAAVVIGMLGDGDEADDVGQETFIRFHAALSRFRGDSSVETYVRRIAMNLSLNALKRRKRARWRLHSRDQSTEELLEPTVAPYDAERTERIHVVRRAVAQLSEKQRSVVVLRLLAERSTNETAEMLDLPPGTVMSRLSRGMEELQRLLAPYATGDTHAG